MAKRRTVGSICKRKDGKGRYLKMSEDVSLKKNEFLNLESQKEQLANLEEAESSGKISSENAAKVRERLNKIPDFVLFELIKTIE